MAEPLGTLLGAARSRWMIGGEPDGHGHPLVQGQPPVEADLRLLAVAGQYQRFCLPPNAPALTERPVLPSLDLPYLPDPLRPLARRLLQDKSDRAPLWLAILVARRSYVLHPVDWMPPPNADLPAAYRPLQLWQAGTAGQATALTSETWLDLPKAERLAQVNALRKTDPAAVQALFSEHFAQSPAEERLALVEALATDLGPDDAAFLSGLANDRSEKVRKVATHLRARLGLCDADPLAAEAASMFELASEGLIRRRKVLRVIPKAKDGQLRSLAQTLPEISLQGLAQALDLSPADFVALWQPETAPLPVHLAVANLIARTAADADLTAYWQKLLSQPELARPCLQPLFARFDPPLRQEAALWLTAQSGFGAAPELLALMGANLPPKVSSALIKDTKALIALVQSAREEAPEKTASAKVEAHKLASLLSFLGLLLTAEDAALIVQTVTDAGIHPAEPMLDLLNFNAALKGS